MKGYLIEMKLDDTKLSSISGGHGLTNYVGVLSSLNNKGFGNISLNLSIIVIAASYIGGNLIINTKQVA